MKINDDFEERTISIDYYHSREEHTFAHQCKKDRYTGTPPSNHRSMLKMLSMNKKKCVSPTQLLYKLSSPPQDDICQTHFI